MFWKNVLLLLSLYSPQLLQAQGLVLGAEIAANLTNEMENPAMTTLGGGLQVFVEKAFSGRFQASLGIGWTHIGWSDWGWCQMACVDRATYRYNLIEFPVSFKIGLLADPDKRDHFRLVLGYAFSLKLKTQISIQYDDGQAEKTLDWSRNRHTHIFSTGFEVKVIEREKSWISLLGQLRFSDLDFDGKVYVIPWLGLRFGAGG